MGLLQESVVYLLAAIIMVTVSRRLGFGSVLGYLAAGILIGPFGIALISDPEHILHFAELGVVFLLFTAVTTLGAAKNGVWTWFSTSRAQLRRHRDTCLVIGLCDDSGHRNRADSRFVLDGIRAADAG